jgi:hypothetical protein
VGNFASAAASRFIAVSRSPDLPKRIAQARSQLGCSSPVVLLSLRMLVPRSSPELGAPADPRTACDPGLGARRNAESPHLDSDVAARCRSAGFRYLCTTGGLACFSHGRHAEREMSPRSCEVSPRIQQILRFRGTGVGNRSQWTTAFFTGCESDSRWRVSAMKQMEYSDVFA